MDTAAPAVRRPATLAQDLADTARTLALAALIALGLRIVLFQPNTIPTPSMEPGVRPGDYLLISKFDYGWSRHSIPFSPPLFEGRLLERPARRGEIVVFKLPRDPRELYIKRVIGLPGDRVELRGGRVLVNGKPLAQRPLRWIEAPDAPGLRVREVLETTPEGRSYVVFDRGPGHPGDDAGPFRVPQGHYFMLGDNRDNSLDSRWPTSEGVGLVPAENLAGRARLVLLSWRDGAALLKPWTWLRLAPERFFQPVR